MTTTAPPSLATPPASSSTTPDSYIIPADTLPVPPPSSQSPPPHARARLCLFLVLSFNSAVVESFSFIFLGNVFCAYMTGTLIILGLSVSHPSGEANAAGPAAVAFGSFCTGSLLGGGVRHYTDSLGLRSTQLLLAIELIFLVPAAVVAGRLDVSGSVGQYISIMLTAIAMGFQMAASISLKVKWLGSPLATGITYTLLAENTFERGSAEKSITQASHLLALLVGAAVGGALGQYEYPWATVLLACLVVFVVIVTIEALCRRSK